MLDAQGELTDETQRNINILPNKCSSIMSDNEHKCVCINVWSIINKTSELDIMVADSDPRVIGVT